MSLLPTAPISVGIPSFQGEARLGRVLEKLAACVPPPAEVLIHCDGGWRPDPEPLVAAAGSLPVRWLHSPHKIGPGGGRDACIRAASHGLVASFDDDSWPLDSDYFGEAAAIMEAFPQAAVLSPAVYLDEKPVQARQPTLRTSRYYQGSASVHRRSHYLTLPGLVPIAAGYGVEEADLSLQMHAAGFTLLETTWLRAWHDRPLADHHHQRLPWIQNEVLLGYLRYPLVAQPWAWWRALRQLLATQGLRVKWNGLRSLLTVRTHCQRFRAYRHRYSLSQIWAHARIRPEVLPFDFSAFG